MERVEKEIGSVGRPGGKVNATYESKRKALAQALMKAIIQGGSSRQSIRELAKSAGVQVNTLQHYFGDRNGAVAAAFFEMTEQGGFYLQMIDAIAELPVQEALKKLLFMIVQGWTRGGLAGAHTAGISEGLAEVSLGPAYINGLLEPTLQHVEILLTRLTERGLLKTGDSRAASLALISPVILGLLHQHQLGGSFCRPLDMNAFIDVHIEHFIRGWESLH